MKITDQYKCDIWYQALLERSIEHTGVFFVGVKTTGVFCISVCRARKPKREMSNFMMMLNLRLMPAIAPAKYADPRRTRALHLLSLSML